MELIKKIEIGKVLILGMEHQILRFQNHDPSDNAMGRSCIKTGEIKLCESMPFDIQEQVMLHEVIHIISDHLDLDMKENQVSALATGLYAFIKENEL